MQNTKEIIEAINEMLEEAVCDGGDAGGAYHQNQEKLKNSIEKFLATAGLANEYKVDEQRNCASWNILKIVPRTNK